ncbi:MarR family transcriptional regulator [Sphingomonas xinjiangensis]|uniref:DNA-binding MarR family transcriptional regulator n=1 Tax=Sphingomonas xinjiangensis TaxID=643568 RepID=A0A840YST1_9SPHN|nr:MarR family transcriptional regulator [Sphingomonas xinjiangensis]MBB5712734.1 DNA-binding MarR family transcriptional regulator [Sphingomonas xinjiangensis]
MNIQAYEAPLTQWKATVLDYVRSGVPDLTNRQMALLLLIHLDEGPHTIRGVAKVLKVTKPVITRALTRLSELRLARRAPDPKDKRNVFAVATPEGAEFLRKLQHLHLGHA